MRRRFRSYRKDARTGSLGRAVPLLLCTRGALTETVVVNVPTSSWLLLCLAIIGVAMTATAIVRADRLGFGNMLWFLSGWLTSELALFHVMFSAVVLAVLARETDALQAGLGSDYRRRISTARRDLLREAVPLRELAAPLALRGPGVEWIRNLPYADGHERHVLDVYRPAGGCSNAPVLMQIHGGGWMLGNKHEQALPLIYHLAQRGWVVVTPNYRLSPKARFPDHLVDCKRALAWDVFRSVRAMESVQAVTRFLEWVRASARPPN